MTIKPGIISAEASEWDQMTLDRKLAKCAEEQDAALAILSVAHEKSIGRQVAIRNLARTQTRLEELSTYVFKYMRDTGETI